MPEAKASRHAYLITAYDEPELLGRLVGLLDDPRNDLYIHWDKRSASPDWERVLPNSPSSQIVLMSSMRVYWGHYSQVRSVFRMLRAATRGGHAYYHLISGADLPIKSQDFIHQFFADNQGTEFVALCGDYHREWVSRAHLFVPLLRSRNKGVRWAGARAHKWSNRLQEFLGIDLTRKLGQPVYYGSDWYSITHDLATYALSRESVVKRAFRHSFIPTEFYMPTIIANSRFADRVFPSEGDPYRSNVRFLEFPHGGSGPRLLGEADVPTLLASERLFARKFSMTREPAAVEALCSALGAAQ